LAFRIRIRDSVPFIFGDTAIMVLAGVAAVLRAITA
jgi:hypothetical protein